MEIDQANRRSFWSALLIGIGIMAAVDEIVFHQLLAWHHFYDRSSGLVGLASDGVLHAAELIIIVVGFTLYADVRRRGKLLPGRAWAGLLLGAGGFQLFDGIVDHKLLRLHQIRYGVDNLFIYDLSWNLFGAVLMLAGWMLLRRARRQSP